MAPSFRTTAIRGHDAEGQMQITYEDKPVRLGDGTLVKLRRPPIE